MRQPRRVEARVHALLAVCLIGACACSSSVNTPERPAGPSTGPGGSNPPTPAPGVTPPPPTPPPPPGTLPPAPPAPPRHPDADAR